MAHTMRRDPIARGGYERFCHGQGKCAGCGQKCLREYSYVWVSDGRTRSTSPDHRTAKSFCAFDCFTSFYS